MIWRHEKLCAAFAIALATSTKVKEAYGNFIDTEHFYTPPNAFLRELRNFFLFSFRGPLSQLSLPSSLRAETTPDVDGSQEHGDGSTFQIKSSNIDKRFVRTQIKGERGWMQRLWLFYDSYDTFQRATFTSAGIYFHVIIWRTFTHEDSLSDNLDFVRSSAGWATWIFHCQMRRRSRQNSRRSQKTSFSNIQRENCVCHQEIDFFVFDGSIHQSLSMAELPRRLCLWANSGVRGRNE